MDDNHAVAEKLQRLLHHPLLIQVVFHRQEIHGVKDHLHIWGGQRIEHAAHLGGSGDGMAGDPLDTDDHSEFLSLGHQLPKASSDSWNAFSP